MLLWNIPRFVATDCCCCWSGDRWTERGVLSLFQTLYDTALERRPRRAYLSHIFRAGFLLFFCRTGTLMRKLRLSKWHRFVSFFSVPAPWSGVPKLFFLFFQDFKRRVTCEQKLVFENFNINCQTRVNKQWWIQIYRGEFLIIQIGRWIADGSITKYDWLSV